MAKPTIIGQPAAPANVVDVTDTSIIAQPQADAPIALLKSTFIELAQSEQSKVDAAILRLNIHKMTALEIAQFESDVEQAFSHMLDGFLSKIDQFSNPQIFELFKQLQTKVDEKNLPDLAEKIMNEQPGFWLKVRLMFSTKKGREAILQKMHEVTANLLRGTTKTLIDEVNALENEVKGSARRLTDELQSTERLYEAYKEQFRQFAISTLVANLYLVKARKQVAEFEATADLNDPTQKAKVEELHDKLQSLESRALALEGMMTKIPADALILRQLKTAGIQTLQELTTTSGLRFANIKGTLITLNTAMVQRDAQKAMEKSAVLDAQLTAVRNQVAIGVVTVAANAPGLNRQKQAEDIKSVIKTTQELVKIAEDAKAANQKRFADARDAFAQARRELAGPQAQQNSPEAPVKKW